MFQDGGISQYLVDYTPFAFQQQQTEKSSSFSNKQNEVGIKDLLGLIKELKGLPIDSAIITDRINDMYTNLSLYNNGQIDTSDLVNTYLSVLRDIRTAEFNKQEYEDAKKETVSNESYNEAAFDQYGNMWIQDTESGEINRVTPEEYISMGDKESYQVLTNSNLLYLRANSPDFAFRNEILSVVHNGTSIKEITEQLQKVANHIGTTTLKEEGYSERTAQNIIEGMATLEKGFQVGMTVQGLYKQGKITKDQTQQAKAALTYLWKTLPANARGLLILKGGSTEGALNLINTLISSSLSPEIDYTQNLIKDPREDSEKDNKTSSEYGGKDDKSNPYFNMIKKIGASEVPVIIQKGNNFISLIGANYSSLPDLNGKPIESTSVDDLLNRGLSGIVTDRNAISFGDQVIKSSDLTNVMYDNSGGTVVELPCKRTSDGRTVVDLSIIDEYEDAIKDIEKLQNPTNEQIAEIYVKHGLMQLIDQTTGLPNKNRFAQFLLIDVYGVNKNDFLKDSEFVEKVDNPDEELVDRIITSLSTNDKKNNYEFDPKDKIIFEGKSNDLYKGVLYIPITINELQAVTAFDKNAKNFYQREYDYQQMMKRVNAGYTKSDKL